MNIKQYLIDSGIEFIEKGKNVSKDFIGISCPFCSDHSNHLGIHHKSGYWNCWICGEKSHNILTLIAELEKCSIKKAKVIFSKYHSSEDDEKIIEKKYADKLWLPKTLNRWPQAHLDYLHSRRFNQSIIDKYKLLPISNFGYYNFRILVPVFINRKMVSWQAADIIRDGSRIAYLGCPPEQSILQLNHCLYNYDSLKNKAVIVEGITDAWRIGDGAVATFTKNFTKEQILLLRQKPIEEIFVLYDSDAVKKAKELAKSLSGIFTHVEYLVLPEGDPSDMSEDKVLKLRKLLNL